MVLAGISTQAIFATSGIIAGCSMATTLIRVHALDAFDTVPRSLFGGDVDGERLDGRDGSFRNGFRSFDAYIDDTNLSAIATRRFVFDSILFMARVLFHAITHMIGGKVAMDKVALVCSCPKPGQDIENKLR